MALSTIKYDEFGKLKHAKWRIVSLGNLDHHKWSNNEYFVPNLSMFELHFLCSLAIKHKCVLKESNVKQAFVQDVLPEGEKY